MPLKKELSKAVLDLISRNDLEEPAQLSSPPLTVENIYPICRHMFSARAQLALDTPAQHLIHQYNNYDLDPRGYVLSILWKLLPQRREMFEAAYSKGNVQYKRELDVVEFVGSTCSAVDIHLAVEKVVTTINHFADKGFMKVSLQPLCILKFVVFPSQTHKLAVLSYISLTLEGQNYAKTYMPKMMFLEGAVPNEVTDQ